jgi:hypothetical protein
MARVPDRFNNFSGSFHATADLAREIPPPGLAKKEAAKQVASSRFAAHEGGY